MLRELRITNLVLIDSLEITFGPGLTVLTGETGAGKSIILQAIHLLAGGKGGPGHVRAGEKEAIVEARFEISAERRALFEIVGSHGFEVEDTLVIRRVLPAGGRSRFYINGGFATAAMAKELLDNILAVASQHDHQQLLDSRYHIDFLDDVGGLGPLRDSYVTQYDLWCALRHELDSLTNQEQDKEQRRDFLAFQAKEINAAAPVVGEDAELITEKERIKAAHDLEKLGREGVQLLGKTVGDAIGQARKNVNRMADFDPSLGKLAERTTSAVYEIEDLATELSHYLSTIPADPAHLDEVAARLDLLHQLKRKYGPSLDDVIAFGHRATEELAGIDEIDQRLAETRHKLSIAKDLLLKEAMALSKAREKTAKEVAAKLDKEFSSLCLEGARFEVYFTPVDIGEGDGFTRSGIDRPEFQFCANPGEPLRPLAQVASGGELSRLMLGLRCILAHRDQVATVLFDEVDAGISGRTAEAVATKLQELAVHHQVLCITHLPQIASRAGEHFLVKKDIAGERTITTIGRLDEENRIEVVAGMLDGDSVSGKTLAYAKELLGRHQ